MTIYDGYYSSAMNSTMETDFSTQEICADAKNKGLSPEVRIFYAVCLAVVAFIGIAAFGDVSNQIIHATPSFADLENWLVWGENF